MVWAFLLGCVVGVVATIGMIWFVISGVSD